MLLICNGNDRTVPTNREQPGTTVSQPLAVRIPRKCWEQISKGKKKENSGMKLYRIKTYARCSSSTEDKPCLASLVSMIFWI